MTFPRLDLNKYYCISYNIRYAAQTKKKIIDKIFRSINTADNNMDNPTSIIKNYKIKNKKYHMHFFAHWHKTKGKKECCFHCEMNYGADHVDSVSGNKIKIDFSKLFDIFSSGLKDSNINVISAYVFEQKEFKSLIELPYTKEGLPIKKNIKIRGLDLDIESANQKYLQYIGVSDKNIHQRIGIFNIKESITSSLLLKQLEVSYGFAKELITEK